LEEASLAERITTALAEVEGVELVDTGDAPDAVVVGALGETCEAEPQIPLTARELEVLALLAEGASNKLIARRLGISAHTAKFHVASLMDKL
jgi:DNA-binding NarL/FixJ family response regulator